ncbi:heme-binding protein [Marinobacter sp. GN3S48]|uniref:GlcG/HbpS family heme-binding protein n=1 Tax=Marinobacter sp. GN3S48 TaxID=3382302 RepID=UPI00387B30EA
MTDYVISTESITLDCALELAHQALTQARQQGRNVAIVVLDSAANPLASIRMDGAPIPCRSIAERKANTALAFSASTKLWDERFSDLSPGVRMGLPLQEKLAFFGGGEPIIHKGERLGSIGISGASEAEDCAIAESAVKHFQALTAKL